MDFLLHNTIIATSLLLSRSFDIVGQTPKSFTIHSQLPFVDGLAVWPLRPSRTHRTPRRTPLRPTIGTRDSFSMIHHCSSLLPPGFYSSRHINVWYTDGI